MGDGRPADEGSGVERLVDKIQGLEAAEERLRLLLDASEILASSIDYETTLANLPRCLVPRFADGCAIDLVPSEGEIKRVAVVFSDAKKAPIAERMKNLGPPDPKSPHGVLQILERGQAILLPSFDADDARAGARDAEHLELLLALELRSGMIVPLRARERSVGVLWLFTTGARRPFDARDLELAQDLGRRAALAIDNARLHRESQEAIRTRDVFVAIASHELKTPLTSLTFQVGAIARTLRLGGVIDEARLASRVGVAERQVERVTALVNTMLDVSRFTTSKLDLERGETDLSALARAVVQRFQPDVERSGVELSVHAPAPVVGSFDESRLDHVIANLIVNALKYGEGRPVVVEVDASNGLARVRVIDRGIGIRPEDHARIFERFERAVSEEHFGGLGVGLWLAREIAAAHGGRITVRSALGMGSTFTCELPLEKA